jgi:hypothetical protein
MPLLDISTFIIKPKPVSIDKSITTTIHEIK